MAEIQISRVGVFGAKGFIGRHLVSRLVSEKIPVVAFGRGFPSHYADDVGDVEQREIQFSDVIGTHAKLLGIDTVVHLINSSSPSLGIDHVAEDFRSNVTPHIGFIESCGMAGVKKIVFLSSGGTVYGNPQYIPIDEKHQTLPMNSYGMSKVIVENYIRLISSHFAMEYINLRVSNPYGPGQVLNKGQGLIPYIIQSHQNRIPVNIYGNGSSQRDYVYISDVIDAILLSIRKGGLQETLNIGSGVGRSVLNVIEAVEQAIGEKIEVSFVDARKTDVGSNVLDTSRARSILGWSASMPFDEGLKYTLGVAPHDP